MKETPDKILENLYLGNMSHSQDYEVLKKLGIKIIISINSVPSDITFGNEFIYLPLIIGDKPT